MLDLLKFCKLRKSTEVQAKVAEAFAVAGWSDLWLPDHCLVVLLAAARESHGAKPSVASWPACQHPVRALLGVRVSKETWQIHRSAAALLSCDSAWNKRAPSISAPELLRVQDSRSQDLRAVGKQVASMPTGSKKHCLRDHEKREKIAKTNLY